MVPILLGETGTQKRRFAATAAPMSPFSDLQGYSNATRSNTYRPDRILQTHTQRPLGSVQENEAALATNKLTHGFIEGTGNYPRCLSLPPSCGSDNHLGYIPGIPSKAIG